MADRVGVAWNYTPFHYGSIAAIKFSRNGNEAAVNVQKVEGLLAGRLWTVNRLNDNINNSRANGNNHLDNNNGRLVGIVRLAMLGLNSARGGMSNRAYSDLLLLLLCNARINVICLSP